MLESRKSRQISREGKPKELTIKIAQNLSFESLKAEADQEDSRSNGILFIPNPRSIYFHAFNDVIPSPAVIGGNWRADVPIYGHVRSRSGTLSNSSTSMITLESYHSISLNHHEANQQFSTNCPKVQVAHFDVELIKCVKHAKRIFAIFKNIYVILKTQYCCRPNCEQYSCSPQYLL